MIIKLIKNKLKRQNRDNSLQDKLLVFKGLSGFLKTKISIPYVSLSLLFLFHIINNIVIISKDTTPFIGDASGLYIQSCYYSRLMLEAIGSFDLCSMLTILRNMPLNGQLFSLVVVPFYFLMGIQHHIAVISNQVFFLVLILSIFGIGRILFNNTAGLLAAFIISFYPSVFGFSRIYMLTFPMLSVATLCVYLLIKSDGFNDRKYSIFFGLACSSGVLLRPRFLIYVFIPVLFYFFKGLISLYQKSNLVKWPAKQIIINIILSVISFCFFLCPWVSFDGFVKYINYQRMWSTLPSFSNIIPTFLHYLKILFGMQLNWFLSFLFLIGLIASLFSRKNKGKIYFLLAWFLISLIILSSFGLKQYGRLAIPLCAPLALITSSGLEKLIKFRVYRYVLLALLFFTVAQYFFISYNPLFDKRPHALMPVPSRNSVRSYFNEIFLSRGLLRMNDDDWKTEQILAELKKRRNLSNKFKWELINSNIKYLRRGRDFSFGNTENIVRVLYLGYCGSPVNNEIEDKIYMENLYLTMISFQSDDFNLRGLFSEEDIQHMVLGADYVVKFKTESLPGTVISRVIKMFTANIGSFDKLKVVNLPWGECEIYGAKVQ
jgi:hypothetical protein